VTTRQSALPAFGSSARLGRGALRPAHPAADAVPQDKSEAVT